MHSLAPLVAILFASVVVITLFRVARIPAMLGYLLVGYIVGPGGLGLISDSAESQFFGEIGIVFLMILALLPWALQYRLAVFLGETAFKHLKSRRKTAARNLEVCFPEWSAAQVQDNTRQVFIDQMIGIFETLNAWYCPYWFKGRFSIEGLEHLQKAQAEGQGVLLLGTHSTLLDAGGYLCDQFFKLGVVYRPQNNPLLDMLIYRCRSASYSCQIDHDDMRGLIRQLKDGQAIWYSPDQDFGLKQGVMAPFFGVPAATVTAHRRLMKISKAAAVPLYFYRSGDIREPSWGPFQR